MRRELPSDLWPHFEAMKERKEDPAVVETPRGVFVVMVTGQQPRLEMTYESVAPSLREEAFAAYRLKRIDAFIDEFRSTHRVTLDADLLDRVPVLP
jgi:hypothetical protein